MYIALKYIGRDFTPGDILPDGLPEEFIHMLLKKGAIREEAGRPKAFPSGEGGGAQAQTDENQPADEPDDEPEPPALDIDDAISAAPVKKGRKGK